MESANSPGELVYIGSHHGETGPGIPWFAEIKSCSFILMQAALRPRFQRFRSLVPPQTSSISYFISLDSRNQCEDIGPRLAQALGDDGCIGSLWADFLIPELGMMSRGVRILCSSRAAPSCGGPRAGDVDQGDLR
jgi:hypothetical protein